MSDSLCEKYGFDHNGRKRRLDLAGLSDDDLPLARDLQRLIVEPNVEPVVEEFYRFLFSQETTHKFLESADRINRLQKTQTQYLLTLGNDFAAQSYFEDRLRIGQVHERIGLPLSLYQCAYRWLENRFALLISRCPGLEDDAREALLGFLLRIITLDSSLATETYFFERVGELEGKLSDIADERDALSQKVEHDTLTTVASREFIMTRLGTELERLLNYADPFSVIMLDLDKFKEVNDTHGHLVGDRVLQEVARRIKAAVRQVDWVGRYGGEEFLLILPGTGKQTAGRIAERVRRTIAATPVHTQEATISTTVSLGVTEAKSSDSTDALVQRADAALYDAKQAERNCVKFR